jgi:hypothetical protein
MSSPDENALNDPALELVLPEKAELAELAAVLLAPKKLPELWSGDEITVKDVLDYFAGGKVVQIERSGYKEPMFVPQIGASTLEKAVAAAVENGILWLRSGPASILGEPIPAGVLTECAKLCAPPAAIAAVEILPENLPNAWKENEATGLSVATVLSVKAGKTLPWKTIRDVINGALQARFLELAEGTAAWPCDFPVAQMIKIKVAKASAGSGAGPGAAGGPAPKVLVAGAELEPSEIQELGDIVPKLLKLKAKANAPIRFHVRIEMGDGKTVPSEETAKEANTLLKSVKEGLQLQ